MENREGVRRAERSATDGGERSESREAGKEVKSQKQDADREEEGVCSVLHVVHPPLTRTENV